MRSWVETWIFGEFSKAKAPNIFYIKYLCLWKLSKTESSVDWHPDCRKFDDREPTLQKHTRVSKTLSHIWIYTNVSRIISPATQFPGIAIIFSLALVYSRPKAPGAISCWNNCKRSVGKIPAFIFSILNLQVLFEFCWVLSKFCWVLFWTTLFIF